jgi:hypothetical protein
MTKSNQTFNTHTELLAMTGRESDGEFIGDDGNYRTFIRRRELFLSFPVIRALNAI